MREISESEANEYNRLVGQGWSLIEGRIQTGEEELGTQPPSWFAKRRLRKALNCFERALKIHPEGWQSLWASAKIHQRLGNHEDALRLFLRAHEINPTHPDVAREASLEALDTGKHDLSEKLALVAVAVSPDDAGLHCNLALAVLMCGEINRALNIAEKAVILDPQDNTCMTVLRLIREIKSGERPHPKAISDLLGTSG